MESYSGHPILSFFRNLFFIVSVFGFCFCAYGLACLLWLKPEDMNAEFTTMSSIILGIAFIVCCPLTVILSKKGKRSVTKEPPQKQFKDLREENK